MGLLNFYKTVFKFNSIKVKVAFFEALAVALTSIVAIVPWKGSGVSFTDVTLTFTPILCLMVAFNISSFTNIHLATTMVLGTLVGSLYCYLILLITNNIIWITFLTTFIFFYISTAVCNIPGRKWMTGLFLKKMFLDVFIILYFTSNENLKNDIIENIYSILFVLAAIVLCSILIPTLASRLIFRKVIKTMNSTRTYFLLIGNLFQEKIYILGGNVEFEIDGTKNENSTTIIKKQIYNQQFEQIENQLIKEQQIKITQGDINSKPTLSVSFKQHPSNSIQELPINLTPLLNSNSLIDNPNNVFQEEKLKLPLSRSKLNDKSSITLDIGNHRSNNNKFNELKDIQSTDNNTIPAPRKKSILSTTNLSKKINIIKTSGLPKSDQDMEILEVELTSRINTMNNLFIESKMERWNDDLNSNYNILISMFETTLKQLISIKLSIKSGFSQISSQELITPLIPFIECLIEEVYLQMGIMIEILNQKENHQDDTLDSFTLLSKSFDETQDLVNRVKGAFKHVVNEYQNGSQQQLLNHDDVTKAHFLVYGVLSFSLQQREFAQLLIKVKKQQRKISERWELIRFGLLFVISGFPLFFIKRLKFFKNKIFSSKESKNHDEKEEEKELKKENNLILLIKWINFNFFKNGKWRFPLQHAFAMMSSIIPFYYVDGKTDSSGKFITFGVWTVTTIIFIIGPNLGASITKGFRETKGTLFGAAFGFLASLLCSIIPTPWKEIVVIVLIFIFFFFCSFPHQDYVHSQSAEICGLTFLLLLLGQNLTQDFDYIYVLLRILHILFGVFWNVFCCLVVFPYFSYKGTRINIFSTSISISETFIKIIENGLRMNESIDIGNKELEIFNHDGDDFQQSNDLIQKRKTIIIKTLLNHKDDLLLNNNNNNNNSNINNIIKIPMNQGMKIQNNRIVMKDEIFKSLNQIRDSIEEIKISLPDVKSELYFVSPKKITKYISITQHLNDCSTTLIALENSFNPIFSDLLIIAMFDLIKPLNDLFQQLKKSNLDLKSTMKGKFKENENRDQVFQHCDLIKEKWLSYQQHFKSNRLFLLNEKVFHLLHPEQIQFGSGFYSIEMFIQSFISLINDLRSIRDETSYLKQFLKLK